MEKDGAPMDNSNPNYVDPSNLPLNKYEVEQYKNQQYQEPMDHAK